MRSQNSRLNPHTPPLPGRRTSPEPTAEQSLLSLRATRPFRHALTGRKLVAYFFGLHVPLIGELHRAIKAQVPSCRKSQREQYGEVYFRAWRNASGTYLQKIEEECLQDLMFHAVHASSTSMATALRQLLQ